MTGRDLVDFAKTLSDGTMAVEYRTAIGRAYYGAFHVAMEFVAEAGIRLPPARKRTRSFDTASWSAASPQESMPAKNFTRSESYETRRTTTWRGRTLKPRRLRPPRWGLLGRFSQHWNCAGENQCGIAFELKSVITQRTSDD
jgi:hypothetical protein